MRHTDHTSTGPHVTSLAAYVDSLGGPDEVTAECQTGVLAMIDEQEQALKDARVLEQVEAVRELLVAVRDEMRAAFDSAAQIAQYVRRRERATDDSAADLDDIPTVLIHAMEAPTNSDGAVSVKLDVGGGRSVVAWVIPGHDPGRVWASIKAAVA